MDEVLTNPVIQTAVIPFVVALVAGALLNRFGWYWAGLAVIIGFIACAWLIMDLKLVPLTSTRKIIMLGMIAVAAGLVLDLYAGGRRFVPYVMFAGGVLATLWVIWPVLMRKQGMEFWLLATGACIYAGWLMITMERLRDQSLRAGSAIFSLGFGTGVSAVMGASALLGQLASSLGAASGAYLLLALFFPKQSAGSTLTAPAALLCSQLAIAGYVYATLPWYVWPVLAIIPPLACIPLPERKPTWIKITLLVAVTLPAAICSILVAWRIEGAPPI
jgi:hypothetical protein